MKSAKTIDATNVVDHNDAVVEMFRDDPGFAAEYLNSVLEDGDEGELLVAMRRLARAFGGVAEISRRTRLNSKTLYRTLSVRGNPELRSLAAILKAMGLRIAVAPLPGVNPVSSTQSAPSGRRKG